MKKIGILVVLLGGIFAGNFAYGQDTPSTPPPPPTEKQKMTPTERAEKKTNKLKEDLNLTDAQTAEIKEINLAHFEEMEQIRQQMKALKKEAKAKRKANDEKVKEVLTDEQQNLFDKKKAERKTECKKVKKQCEDKPE